MGRDCKVNSVVTAKFHRLLNRPHNCYGLHAQSPAQIIELVVEQMKLLGVECASDNQNPSGNCFEVICSREDPNPRTAVHWASARHLPFRRRHRQSSLRRDFPGFGQL